MSYTLPATHSTVMEVSYVDAHGNPAEVDGAVIWQTSHPSLATLDVDIEDSSMVRVMPTGKLGQLQLTATADVDLGKGVKHLVTICDIEIVAGDAVTGDIQPLGEPELRRK